MIALTTVRARHKLRAALLCLSCLAGSVSHAHAQTGGFTLQSAEKTALEHAPRVRSALASRQTAYAYRTFGQMPRAGNPFVAMRAMIGKPDAPAATYSIGVGLPFDITGKRPAWRREAGYIVSESEARLLAVQNEVRAEARSAYVNVSLAVAARGVAEQSAATARELLERIQARLDANAATALDVAQSESAYAEATANVSRAQRNLVEAQNAFRQALGLSHDAAVEVAPVALPTLPAGLTLEAAVERARTFRKETVAWESASQRWRTADRRLRAEAMQPVFAGIEGEAQGNHNTNKSVGANVNFELPVILRNQGERAVARGEAAAAGVERELSSQLIEREASSSYRRLEAALGELAAIEEGALPAAERTLTMIGTMLDAGVVDYFRLLAARSGAFALRSRRVEALREAWQCRIALERAIGGWEETP